MEARIALDFKGFWGVLARENPQGKTAENTEEKFCQTWSRLKDAARTGDRENNITNT
jgi:hypothetical protein